MAVRPLLILSDDPTCSSGLGRITRDLATRINTNLGEHFRVATLGTGGAGSCKLPFPQYHIHDVADWVAYELPEVWMDFAGGEQGIVMTIWDATRLGWLANPEKFCQNPALRSFLQQKPFELWGYFPVDAVGPNGMLGRYSREVMSGFDRVLTYSDWAMGIIARTLGAEHAENVGLDAIPHGIDTEVFYPRDRAECRANFGRILFGVDISFTPEDFVVGIVATNQERKDFGTALHAISMIAQDRPVKLWVHTDVLERHWSLPNLANDFGIERALVTTGNVPDEVMAMAYSACDVTLGIGLGEGFGFPIFESLACGTHVIHGSYGGAREHLRKRNLIEPIGFRFEGLHNCLRPIFSPMQWAAAMRQAPHYRDSQLPARLMWKNLWNEWEKWFLQTPPETNNARLALVPDPVPAEEGEPA